MPDSRKVSAVTIFDSEAILSGGTAEKIVDINAYRPLGNFATQLKVEAGPGTITIDLYVSLDGDNYVLSRSLWDAEVAGDWKLESHGSEVAIKAKFVATANSGDATVSMILGIQ